ncbi:hypothetical protein HK096_007594, partial [Nowakowskiella sp. JEL0078]
MSSDVLSLSEQLPSRGTQLDDLCMSVFKSVMQLILAANKNFKPHYIAISAKAIHYSEEILREIEVMERHMNVAKDILEGKEQPDNTFAEEWDNSFLLNSPIREKIVECSRELNTEHCRQLLVNTRIAVGVWPPVNSISEMIKAAAAVAKSCRQLTYLGNSFGYFPVLDKTLSFEVEPFLDPEVETPTNTHSPNEPTTTVTSFSAIKRLNQLQMIQEATKSAPPATPISLFDDPTTDFFTSLDNLVRQFVSAVSDLRNAHTRHLKDAYSGAAMCVVAAVDALVAETTSFDMLADLSAVTLLEPDDLQPDIAALVGVAPDTLVKLLPPDLVLPTPMRELLAEVVSELNATAAEVLAKASVASGVWPPPGASIEMVQASIPCAIAIKRLVVLAKHCVGSLWRTVSEDRLRKEQWRKKCLQNENVKKLFLIWDTGAELSQTTEVFSDEDKKVLFEIAEGLNLETNSNGIPVIKAGRLQKIIELMTSIENKDPELISSVLLTHHSFTSSIELLNLLIKRYGITPEYGLEPRLFDLVINKKIVPIRL